jgi:uncharacterized membrane protein YkvA (DUF1232 family)
MDNKESRDALVAAVVSSALLIMYVLSPIDLIPDFIPIIGWMDDVTLVILAASVGIFAMWEMNREKPEVAETPPEVPEPKPYEPIPAEKIKAL